MDFIAYPAINSISPAPPSPHIQCRVVRVRCMHFGPVARSRNATFIQCESAGPITVLMASIMFDQYHSSIKSLIKCKFVMDHKHNKFV